MQKYGRISKLISPIIYSRRCNRRIVQPTLHFSSSTPKLEVGSNLGVQGEIELGSRIPEALVSRIPEAPIREAVGENMPATYICDMDTPNLLNAITPLDLAHTTLGGMTFGVMEGSYYCMQLFENMILTGINTLGLGFGGSLFCCTLAIRFCFAPLLINVQHNAIKLKLLGPEEAENKRLVKNYNQSGNKSAAELEKEKFKKLKKKHGIYLSLQLITFLQIPVYIGAINCMAKMALSPEYGQLLTQKFFWISDWTLPDPYGIFPILTCVINMLSLYASQSMSNSMLFRKLRRYLFIFPFIFLPIWLAAPATITLFWTASSIINCSVMLFCRTNYFKQKMGVDKPLEGTILQNNQFMQNLKLSKTYQRGSKIYGYNVRKEGPMQTSTNDASQQGIGINNIFDQEIGAWEKK